MAQTFSVLGCSSQPAAAPSQAAGLRPCPATERLGCTATAAEQWVTSTHLLVYFLLFSILANYCTYLNLLWSSPNVTMRGNLMAFEVI